MTFRVGQLVECINAKPRWLNFWGLDGLKARATYTIRRVGADCVWLNEIVRPPFFGHEPPYWSWRFRPLVERKTEISIFTKMLTPEGVDA